MSNQGKEVQEMHVKKKGRKSKAPPIAEFNFRYYECNLSAEEMALYYGVKIKTIYNWATMFRKQEEQEQ